MPEELPILFIGGLFDEEQRNEVDRLSTGSVQSAADVLQWGYVHGLEALPDSSLSIRSAPFVGSYPRRYSRIWIRGRKMSYGDKEENRIVGFLNLALVKQLWAPAALTRSTQQWLTRHPGEGVVFGYALTLQTLFPLWSAKRRAPSVTAIAIVPDLPEFMNTSSRRRPLRTPAKKIVSAMLRRMLSQLDGMVILTEHMAERLPPLPHVVIEGIIDEGRTATDGSEVRSRHGLSEAERVLLYSGGLNEKYGVLRLCEAFRALDAPDLRLVLCGAGDAASEIVEHARQDDRIRFLGRLPRSDVLALQSTSLALVNPRSSDEEFSRYSFPSKILEYLSAQRPVLCYKLDGIPDDYDQHLRYVAGPTVEDLTRALQQIIDQPPEQLAAIGMAGRNFVVDQKNPRAQVRKVMAALRPDPRWE